MKILITLTIITLQQLFALISIVPVEIGQKPGLSGKLQAGLDTKRGNTHTDNYNASTRINYDNNSSFVLWGELSGEYGEANDIENTNNIYSHIRLIHTIGSSNTRAEVFLQTEEDKFRAISARRVAGSGLRFKVLDILEGSKGYYGLGAMYEYIQYVNPLVDPKENNIRLNTYLTYTLKLNDNSNFAYTFYYQPSTDDFNDHVISNKLELKLRVYEKLFLKFNISYNVDSKPPVGVKEDYDFRQSTTFVFDF